MKEFFNNFSTRERSKKFFGIEFNTTVLTLLLRPAVGSTLSRCATSLQRRRLAVVLRRTTQRATPTDPRPPVCSGPPQRPGGGVATGRRCPRRSSSPFGAGRPRGSRRARLGPGHGAGLVRPDPAASGLNGPDQTRAPDPERPACQNRRPGHQPAAPSAETGGRRPAAGRRLGSGGAGPSRVAPHIQAPAQKRHRRAPRRLAPPVP